MAYLADQIVNSLASRQAQIAKNIGSIIVTSEYDSNIEKSLNSDIETGMKFHGYQNQLEKGGEGSRGGKIIGHTKSGKPIYDSANHAMHSGFTPQDHSDAHQAHMDLAIKHKNLHNEQVKSGSRNNEDHFSTARDHAIQAAKHKLMAGDSNSEHKNITKNSNGTYAVHVKTNKGTVHYNEDGADGNMQDEDTAKTVHENMSSEKDHEGVHSYAKALKQAGGGHVRHESGESSNESSGAKITSSDEEHSAHSAKQSGRNSDDYKKTGTFSHNHGRSGSTGYHKYKDVDGKYKLTSVSEHTDSGKQHILLDKHVELKGKHPSREELDSVLKKHLPNIQKSIEVYTPEAIQKFQDDLSKAFDNEEISEEEFEKGMRDVSGLQKKIITNKEGHQQTVYIRVNKDNSEHHFNHGDKVTFEHGGKQRTGIIKKLKDHPVTDKFGTAHIEDEHGNKYSKSLRALEHHSDSESNKTHTPVAPASTTEDEDPGVTKYSEADQDKPKSKEEEHAHHQALKDELKRVNPKLHASNWEGHDVSGADANSMHVLNKQLKHQIRQSGGDTEVQAKKVTNTKSKKGGENAGRMKDGNEYGETGIPESNTDTQQELRDNIENEKQEGLQKNGSKKR